jgi:thioesterase domain-containing protein
LKLYLATNRPVPRRFRDFYFMQIVTKAANHHYNPEVYPGKAILFRSILEGENDPKLGWDGLPAEGLQVYDIEANHLGILKRPHIEKVAQTLRTHIEAAQLQEW